VRRAEKGAPGSADRIEEQLVRQIEAHKYLERRGWKRPWFERVVTSEPPCEAVGRLYAGGVDLRKVFTPKVRVPEAAFHKRAPDSDDYTDAVRDLIRRAMGKRRG
jgi:hypothetical protein